MSPNFIQEQLSLAYLRAVVYRAGFRLYRPETDDHGVDGTIVDPDSMDSNRVDYQLKSTTRYAVSNGRIAYDLRVADFNRLILQADAPKILILFIMPADASEWLRQSEDELCLRRCAYWVSLEGLPRSDNAATVRVFIPEDAIFNESALRALLD